jgi:translocation and assembly module TamB
MHMSIGNKKKRQPPATSTTDKENSPRPSRPKRRRLTFSAIAILGLVLLVGLLPTIIAHTSLMGYFVRRTARLDGTITFRSASIGWFSSSTVSGVEICDNQGETVLEAESLTCDRSLLKLIFRSSNIGRLRIEKPRLGAKLTRDGSNVESVLAYWLTAPSSPSSQGVDLSLEIADGEAMIVDQETQQSWHVVGLQFALDMSRRLAWPTRMEGAATVDDRGHPGGLALKWHLTESETPPADPSAWCGLAGTDGDLSLQTNTLPLAMFQRLAARGVPGLKLDGVLGSNIEAQWTGPANVKLSGNIIGGDLSVETSSLGRDVVRLDKLQAACKAARQDRQLTIEEAKVDCEVGNLAASGRVDLGERGLETLADLMRQPDCSVQGTLDLARLARLLPGTLRIRPGTEISSGQVQLSVRTTNSASAPPQGPAAAAAPPALSWRARLQTNNILAVNNGRQIPWDKPVLIDVAIHQTDQGPVVDSLQCQSDFLSVDGSGTPNQLTASVTLHLQQLTDDLSRFVDLGGLALSGDGDGKIQWNRTAAGDFDAGGQIDLRKFQLSIPQRQPWAEDTLTIVLGAKGHADPAAQTRLDEATLQLRSGGDQVDIRLLQPTNDWSLRTPIPLGVQVQGGLDRWPSRLAPLVSTQSLRLGGSCQAAGQAALSATSLAFSQVKINATQFAVHGVTWNWSDPAIELNVAGRFDLAASRLQLDAASLAASTISLNAKDVVYTISGSGPLQISGTVTYQGDMERLQPWIVAATGGTGLRLAGRVNGTAQLQQSDGQIACKAENDVDQLVVTAPSGQSFQEPRVHCALQCNYQIASNVLKIDQCELSSGAAGARAGGQIVLGNPGDVQLSGEVNYQWDKLNLLLQPYCGTSIQFSGSGASGVSYRGPLAPSQGEAAAALMFTAANVYGFQVGPGELKLHLANRVLRADPLVVACNQGRLALQPELRIDRQPIEFRLSAGTLARQVQLDQTACRSALRYVVPVLASVTRSEGQFSIELDGCRIPIGDMNRAEIAGRIIVHSAAMSPGPVVQQLASLLVTNPALVRIQPESVIQFRMTGGRIYHQGLAMEFPELTVRTYGSVGLDDSLKLMIETSIPLAWLPSNAVTDAIKKQKMQIPMDGTLKSPKLDLAELARVKSQVLGNLARGVLQSELGNQLNRFIQPKQ